MDPVAKLINQQQSLLRRLREGWTSDAGTSLSGEDCGVLLSYTEERYDDGVNDANNDAYGHESDED